MEVDASIVRSRVSFEQGDACDLPTHLGQFDVIHASNLLCRQILNISNLDFDFT